MYNAMQMKFLQGISAFSTTVFVDNAQNRRSSILFNCRRHAIRVAQRNTKADGPQAFSQFVNLSVHSNSPSNPGFTQVSEHENPD